MLKINALLTAHDCLLGPDGQWLATVEVGIGIVHSAAKAALGCSIAMRIRLGRVERTLAAEVAQLEQE